MADEQDLDLTGRGVFFRGVLTDGEHRTSVFYRCKFSKAGPSRSSFDGSGFVAFRAGSRPRPCAKRFGIHQAEIEGVTSAATAVAAKSFRTLWVLWKGVAY